MTYGHLQADCLYTGISSGPKAWYRVWEAFTFYLFAPSLCLSWMIRGKIVRIILCCIAYDSCVRTCLFCSLDCFVLVLFAFVVLGLVSSVLSQKIGWEERLQNDPFCVEWDVKPSLYTRALATQSRRARTKTHPLGVQWGRIMQA